MNCKNMKPLFFARPIETINKGDSVGQHQRIGIFQTLDNGGERQIGEYVRNYANFYQTFCPFLFDKKWFALYSRDYSYTSLLKLPDCKEIGSEKVDGVGFCPVDYYVPKNEFYCDDEKSLDGLYYPFGFVSGCKWGDDITWKVEYLDLSQVSKGIIRREAKFGRIELPLSGKSSDRRLQDSIYLHQEEPGGAIFIEIETSKRFTL